MNQELLNDFFVAYLNGLAEKHNEHEYIWHDEGDDQITIEFHDKRELSVKDITVREYYKNGQIRYEYNYINGKRHGKQTIWHDNGQMAYEDSYKNGKYHGKQTCWYKNGQMAYEENYKNGKRHGKQTTWHSNGQIRYEHYYKNGKRA